MKAILLTLIGITFLFSCNPPKKAYAGSRPWDKGARVVCIAGYTFAVISGANGLAMVQVYSPSRTGGRPQPLKCK